MKQTLCFSILLICLLSAKAQQPDSTRLRYDNCFDSLKIIISNNGAFKKAAFITENCFLHNLLSYDNFEKHISKLTSIIKGWQYANPLINYHYPDSIDFHKNFAVFKLLKDTIKIIGPDEKKYLLTPYTYDFNDFFGKQDWSNMFVTKLLGTHKGNCHNLPYLYKILADEINCTCWLSLAPNHLYIKNRSKQIGWYNIELTSGEFPIDAWITASGYIPLQAVQNGIYMDTLSNQQSIALCILDLAKEYEFQTKNYQDGFILKCCNEVLQYHPVNVQALLLKAETLKRIYEKQRTDKHAEANNTYAQMERLYVQLFDLGYREMPDKMYLQWLASITKQRNKFSNKQFKETVKGIK